MDKASADNECDLGKWLHSVGTSKYRDLPEFVQLMNSHRMFHSCVRSTSIKKTKSVCWMMSA
ncbi:CZB domain-containing protein [Citrobacter amalonaticus]|uniref:CZB domain-containing protein n=1 Tax=Citrobacter amalonaticus TaxID=35703 RepID=UPI0039B70097